MADHGAATGIAPFWSRFGTFLAAPLHAAPLMLLGLVAAGGLVAGFLGPLALILRGIVLFAVVRFAFQIFDEFSAGRFNVDSPDIVTWPAHDARAGKQGLLLVVYFGFMVLLAGIMAPAPEPDLSAPVAVTAPYAASDDDDAAAAVAGAQAAQADDPAQADAGTAGDSIAYAKLPAGYWLVAVLLALPLPAATLVLALEHKLLKALNPLHTVTCIRAMGAGYFILLGYFAAIVIARAGISAAARGLPELVHYPVEGIVVGYLTLVLYALLGYVAYQYHGELGLEVAVDFEEHARRTAAAAAPPPADPFERKIHDLLQEGKVDEAIAEVKDQMRYDRFDVKLNARLHDLYVKKGDPELILKHGQHYVDSLVRADQGEAVLDLVTRLQGFDPAFASTNDRAILPMAQAAYRRRDYKRAMALIKGFDRAHPGHEHIPGVYLLGAKLASEVVRNDQQAMAILKALLARHPQAACADEARQYLTVLEGMARTASAPTA